MMRTKIRTLGFALLGAGRTDEAAPQSAPVAEQMKRLGAGGWGRSQGGIEMDKELEDLIASDQPQQQKPAERLPSIPAAGKYHRVGSDSAPGPDAALPATQAEEAQGVNAESVRPDSEGFYELCIKSVEAVKWDPEQDEAEMQRRPE